MASGLTKVLQQLQQESPQTDGQLLARFVALRDEDAFAVIVRRHGPMVLGVCSRILHDSHDAEDAFQATFLVLARKAASVVKRESLSCWLYGVAYRIALRAGAANLRRRAREKQVTNMPHPQTRPAETQDWRPLLDQELSRLPQRYQAAIVLCDLDGHSRKEAARQLRIPEGTLSSRLAGGRKLLARRLRNYGIALSGGALAAALAERTASAQVPATLVGATARAAVQVVAGQVAAVSPTAVFLMSEGLKAMLMKKLNWVATVLLGLVLLGSGGGVLSYQAATAQTGGTDRAAVAAPNERAAPADEEKLKTLLVQKLKEIDDLQDRVKALEDALAEKNLRLELALLSHKMDEIKERLATASGGKVTQDAQKDVFTRLDKLVQDTEQRQKKLPGRKLGEVIAEVKLIQAMQKRVNVRTEVCGKQYLGEVVPVPSSGKDAQEKEKLESIHRELKELSERQAKIGQLTHQLATVDGSAAGAGK